MRITAIRSTPVAVPFDTEEAWAYGSRKGMLSVLVEVDTDEGITGLGEAPAYPSADVVLAVLRTIEPLVVGEDPFRTERLSRLIDVVGTWHHVRSTSPAMVAVDMACWDILGKSCGQPLVNLLGGRLHDEVEYACYVPRGPAEWMRDRAAEAAREGARGFYLKVGADDLDDDVRRVAAVRDGIGPRAALRVDANEAWSPTAALRAVRALDEYDLEFVEQPVSGRNLPEMARLRARIDTPVLANEASWTRHDHLDVIREGAADALSADNQLDGGLMNMKRAAGICEAAGLAVVKHSLGELGVATCAAAAVIASTPGFRYASQSYGDLLADDVVAGGVLPRTGGRLRVPDRPGIGVELDPDRVARYAERFTRSREEFQFDDPRARAVSPELPKR